MFLLLYLYWLTSKQLDHKCHKEYWVVLDTGFAICKNTNEQRDQQQPCPESITNAASEKVDHVYCVHHGYAREIRRLEFGKYVRRAMLRFVRGNRVVRGVAEVEKTDFHVFRCNVTRRRADSSPVRETSYSKKCSYQCESSYQPSSAHDWNTRNSYGHRLKLLVYTLRFAYEVCPAVAKTWSFIRKFQLHYYPITVPSPSETNKRVGLPLATEHAH